LLFIKTTLSENQLLRSGTLIQNQQLVQQPWHYGLNINNLVKILIQKVQQHGS